MEQVQRILDYVPIWVLALSPLVGLALYLLIPRVHRMWVMIACAIPWLTISVLNELGMLAALSKATGILALGMVMVAAATHPGPRRRLMPLVWLYPVMAALGPLFVATTVDNFLALVLRAQWFVLVLAGIFVARTIVDARSLMYVLHAIATGLAIAIWAPFSAFLTPSHGLSRGLFRFEPWGANANQIGVTFTMTIALCGYLGMRARGIMKPFWFAIASVALGMAVLTGSRSTMITTIGSSIPLALVMLRRPLTGIAAGTIVVAILSWFIVTVGADTAFFRYGSFETSRVQQFFRYLEVIGQRPIIGLAGTTGQLAQREEDLETHAHNAYLQIAYMGGLIYLLPHLLLVGLSMWFAFVTWKQRRRLDTDPLLISTLVAFMFMCYAHGFVNDGIYHPTFVWALFHVLLSCLLLTLGWELSRAPVRAHEPAWDAEPEFQPSHA
jgi:hypothetical protein